MGNTLSVSDIVSKVPSVTHAYELFHRVLDGKLSRAEFETAVADLETETDDEGEFTFQAEVRPRAALPEVSPVEVVDVTPVKERVPVSRNR